MKTYENQSAVKLIARIQEYVDSKVIAVRGLEIVGDGDSAIFPFAYQIEGNDYFLRGAFTNGDPVWEEDDGEAFAKLMGETDSA